LATGGVVLQRFISTVELATDIWLQEVTLIQAVFCEAEVYVFMTTVLVPVNPSEPLQLYVYVPAHSPPTGMAVQVTGCPVVVTRGFGVHETERKLVQELLVVSQTRGFTQQFPEGNRVSPFGTGS